jgi:hypothetical protein
MGKKFTVEVTVPDGVVAGDTFELEVEAPSAPKKQRGMLAGIALEDMDDAQLKRELINANSVLYKAKQRGAAEETITANELRVEAAKAEKAKRVGTVEAVAPELEAALEDDIMEEI